MNVLTDTLGILIASFQNGWNNILPDITNLFAILLVIEVILFGLVMALMGKGSYADAVWKAFVIGVWGWVVFNFPALSLAFFNSLIQIGFSAGGLDPNVNATQDLLLDPSQIAGLGLTASAPLADSIANVGWNFADALVMGIAYLVIMICFLIFAIQVFLCQIEYYLAAAIIGVFLPFALMSPTRFMAEKALGAIFAISVKVGVISFLISVSNPIINNVATTAFRDAAGVPLANIEWNDLWVVLLISLTMAYMAWQIPGMVAGLLTGTPSLSFGSAISGATALTTMTSSSVRTATGTASRTVSAMHSATSGMVRVGAGVATGARISANQFSGAPRLTQAARVATGALMGGAGAATNNKIDRMKAAAQQAVTRGRNQAVISTGGRIHSNK